jgi:SpoVK/Ycf46/Vps4 family AAA+-type ATPase
MAEYQKILNTFLGRVRRNHPELVNEDQPIYPTDNESKEEGEYFDSLIRSKQIEISFLELSIINKFLYGCYRGVYNDLKVISFGTVDQSKKIRFDDEFNMTTGYWFMCSLDKTNVIIQTSIYLDTRNELNITLNVYFDNPQRITELDEFIKYITKLSFNYSEFRGKCIKVKLKDSSYKGIEIINLETKSNELILNETQRKFINHFIARVKKGGTARYLLNGEAGTGKTESIREIARSLVPDATFIIPDFDTTDDLISILEACELFENAVIILDDIDLYLGNRENGSYTRLLGQFLSFFDGVKKRKISLIASTNDKGLVDKAAERPGRFNFTLDYTFLSKEQIEHVCNIHLPEKWRIQEVYDKLTGKINGKTVNITGAFIANLAENIIEMSDGDDSWTLSDTLSLIEESYKGFYSSQIEKEKNTLGFSVK